VTDAIQYLMAGASLIAIGTAAMQRPRIAEALVRDFSGWCETHGVGSLRELISALSWES